ncbi:MAG: DUF5123 domain-containing protein [Bacteroidota bacterium]|nr:DUF5123 domain-containing protein [Bacteroidota bacterium]
MRNYNINKYLSGALFLILLIIGMGSCKNGEPGWDADMSYSSLFRSLSFTTYKVGTDTVEIAYNKVIAAKKYILELSDDSLQFGNIIQRKVVLADTVKAFSSSTNAPQVIYHLLFTNLNADARYSVRMIAVNADSTLTSKYSLLTFKTAKENIFKTVNAVTNITAGGATVNWNYTDRVDSLFVTKDADNSLQNLADVKIVASEKSGASKIITGLAPGTYYTAKLSYYDGKKRWIRGSVTFKTLGTANSYMYPLGTTDNISTVLSTLVSQGHTRVTFTLTAGATYNLGTINIPAGLVSLTLTAPAGSNTIVNTSGVNLASIASLDGFLFENVNLVGTTAGYMFRQATSISINDGIDFEGCTVSTFRGVFADKGAAGIAINVNKILFNNCIIKNIQDYSVVSTTAYCNITSALKITNSTLIENGSFIGLTNSIPNLTIANCTFYNNTKSLAQLIKFTTVPAVSAVTIDKCIFSGPNSTIQLKSFYANYSGFTTYDFSSSYRTSDLQINTGTGTTFTNLKVVSYTSANFFTDPTNGVFTLKTGIDFPGKGIVGDPRWW